MASTGGWTHGIPDDPAERAKIRARLDAADLAQFDAIVARIDAGRKPNNVERTFIRQLKAQGKIKQPSKRFKSKSDKKTHQDP